MRQSPTDTRRAIALAALLAVAAAPAEALRIQGTATDHGGHFSYELYVVDNVLPNLIVVSLLDAPLADPLIGPSLTAPAGYLASYDSGLGFIDFLADTAFYFDVPTTGPFTFDSLYGPGSYFTQSAGLDDNFDPVAMDPVDITVLQDPNGQAPAPGGLALLGLGLGLLARRRRGTAHSHRRQLHPGGSEHEPH